MIDPVPKPNELKLLCLAFLLWSILSIAADVPRWTIASSPSATTYKFSMDFGAFGFLASIGLWRLSSAGRTFALVLTWYWLVGSVLLFFQVFPTSYLKVTANSDFLAAVPQEILRAFVVPFFLVQLWQLHALTRPHLKALFKRPSKHPVA